MKNLLLLILLIAALASCSKKINPVSGYHQIQYRSYAVKIGEIPKRAPNAIPIGRVQKNSLGLNDSILIYKDNIYSNYKIFSFQAMPSRTYTVKVNSQCDCGGFTKYMFEPEISVFNKSGKIIEAKMDTSYVGINNSPMFLNKSWLVRPDENTECCVIVYSNNEALGKDLVTTVANTVVMSGGVFIPLAIPIDIKATLVGDFVILVK